MSLAILIASAMLGASSTAALAATAPSLGSAANFAVLSAAPLGGGAVTCTNGTITGNVGSTGAASSVAQTTCALTGSIVAPVSAQVVTDFNSAFAAYAAIPCDQVLTGTLAGIILAPGVYCFDAAAGLTGTLTLNGPPTGTWIFKIGTGGTGGLTGSSFSVVMAGGALPCNVSWQVAQAATMTDSAFIGTILAGADITLTRGTFTGDALATAGMTNTGANLTGCPPPPPTADIGITKTVDNATPILGSNVTFTITATNHGPDTATRVQVTDQLPAGLSQVSATPSAGTFDAGTGVWDIGSLANAANATLSIVASVTRTGALTNTASKTAEDEADPVSGNNSAAATVTPLEADIAITKTVDNPTPNLGSAVTFIITATNNGPGDATGAQVTDVLPAGLTYVSSLASAGTFDSATGLWSIGSLGNGGNASLTITATVTSASPMTNTASKVAEDQLDPVSANNTASATEDPVAADIAITKTVDNPTPRFGSNATFTIIATNNGPSAATGVQVTDLLPAGLTFVSAVASTGTYDAVSGIWTLGALASPGNATLSIVATVTESAPITNTATKTAGGPVDPVSGNNTASAIVSPVAADIAIAKTVDNATPDLGSNVTFRITATNVGPSNATGVQVTDVLPAGFILVLATPSAGTYDSATGIWNIGPIASGSIVTLLINATVTGTAAVTNTATKTAEVQVDQVSSNNAASATVTGQAADIGVAKTVDNPAPNLGSNVIFTITATNHGPSDATGVQVTDQLPAGLTFVTATASMGTYDSVTGLWNIGPMANLGNATLSITATAIATAVMTNTAAKTAEDQPDSVSTNNSAAVIVTGQAADIGVTKTVNNANPNAGSDVIFTITATNHGPSDATGVQVTDFVPAGLTLVSVSASSGTYDALTGVWNIGPLANLENATLSVIATVTGTAAVANTATRTAEDQTDSISANNSAGVTVTGQLTIGPAADIAVTKTVDNTTPNLGTNVIFTIAATNNGPGDATGIQVIDQLPAGLTYVSATASTGSYDPVTGVWDVGPLADLGSATLSIVATVTRTASVANFATKTAEDQSDLVSTDDSASATVTGQSADIGVTKTVSNSTPILGSNVTFTINASNHGPSDATGIQVTEFLPAGLTFVSATASKGTYDPVTGLWNIGPMANLGNATLLVVAAVTGTTAMTNTASRTAEVQPDLVSGDDAASVTVTGHGPTLALPGLPNTSAPEASAWGPVPNPPEMNPGLVLAIVAMVAGLAVLAQAGIGHSRSRAAVGQRRSRRRKRLNSGGLAAGWLALVLSLAISSSSAGEGAPGPSPPAPAFASGTQLIGTKVVSVVPPAAPQGKTFQRVAGPITPSRIRVPAIGVDALIAAVGLRADGSMDVPDNLWTSSWLRSGPQPGQAGNAVIAGHRGVGSPALFSHLENLRPGDRIYVSDAAGNELIYLVTRVASLDLSRSTQVAVFGPTSGQHLVLVTCFGRYIPSARSYDHRLVVFSRLLPLID